MQALNERGVKVAIFGLKVISEMVHDMRKVAVDH